MPFRHLVFRVHALRRMFERNISIQEVREALIKGEIIEEYPDDQPYPSYLMLAYVRSRNLHIVAADADDVERTIIITVYEPDPGTWDKAFRRRIK